MSIYLDKARELRNRTDVHYNCAQGVLVPFANDLGLGEDMAIRLGANFGSGMKMGSTCGAVTGALMVLGLDGITDSLPLIRQVKENHNGLIDCRDLLRENAKTQTPKKEHCDGMVYELVEMTERILREKGKIE